MDIGAVGKVQTAGPVAGRIRDVRTGRLGEARVEVGLRAVELPAHAGHPVDEHAAIAATAVDVVGTEHRIVVELEAAERVLAAEIHVPLTVVEMGHLGGDIDGRRGDRPDFGDARRESRNHAGRGGVGHGALVAGEGPEQIAQTEAFERVVVDQV